MDINPIGNPPPIEPDKSGSPQSGIVAQMNQMLKDYREHLKVCEANPSPKNIEKLCSFAYKLRSFLEEHKQQIFSQAKQMGWPKNSGMENDGYESNYNDCINGLNTLLNPETRKEGTLTGKLDFTNEQLTQLTWLVQNGNNKA